MLYLLFPVAFWAASLALHVPPIRSLNLFVERLVRLGLSSAASLRSFPRLHFMFSRFFFALFHSTR
ncbi:hypothetical protein NMG60_11005376 [Bertholletia excelsa]